MSVRSRIKSFGYALHGLRYVLTTQVNFQIHLVIAVVVIIAGFIFNISTWEWIAIAFSIGFVFVAEILNTALDVLCDRVHPEEHASIRVVKDVAAGAVLIAAVTALVIGVIVFLL